MKLMSWNVNGIRAVQKKLNLEDLVRTYNLDVLCLQEVKAEQAQANLALEGFNVYWNASKIKKGYSGVAILTKHTPLSVKYDMGIEEHDQEGRLITLEYEDFFLVTVYTPNSKDGLLRLSYRVEWEKDFLNYLKTLEKTKAVVLCGDLNVAHEEIDLANPKDNTKNPGFTPEERERFSILLDNGFIDTFRYFYPSEVKYSWWSYRTFARERNIGWRIDYFVVSKALEAKLVDAKIMNEIKGSDHCPVYLEIKA